jgi:two-component system response regulator HydG
VRELRNAMERALLLRGDATLDASDFAPEPGARAPASGTIPFPAPLGDIVRTAARETLALCGGNKSEAARRLGISRPRLQRLLDASDASADLGDDLDA